MKETSKNRSKREQNKRSLLLSVGLIPALGDIFYSGNAGAITAGKTVQCFEQHSLYSGNKLLQVTIGNE